MAGRRCIRLPGAATPASSSCCAPRLAPRGQARIAKLLLDGKYEGKGAAINLQTSNGDTALIWASFDGHEAVVRLLLERGADVTLRNTSGRTALYWARLFNHAAVVALLEARGAPE